MGNDDSMLEGIFLLTGRLKDTYGPLEGTMADNASPKETSVGCGTSASGLAATRG